MHTHRVLWTVITLLAAVCTAHAQEPRDFSLLPMQTVQLPGTSYSIVFNSPELQVGEARNMVVLSVAVASWLSANFGLPTMHDLPHVEYVSSSEIALFRSTRSGMTETTAKIPVVYVSVLETIYLPEGWDGSTFADLSLFVFGMAEHLRQEAKIHYYCEPAHDGFALAVQKRWLAMVGNPSQRLNTAGDGDDRGASPGCVLRQSRLEN